MEWSHQLQGSTSFVHLLMTLMTLLALLLITRHAWASMPGSTSLVYLRIQGVSTQISILATPACL